MNSECKGGGKKYENLKKGACGKCELEDSYRECDVMTWKGYDIKMSSNSHLAWFDLFNYLAFHLSGNVRMYLDI